MKLDKGIFRYWNKEKGIMVYFDPDLSFNIGFLNNEVMLKRNGPDRHFQDIYEGDIIEFHYTDKVEDKEKRKYGIVEFNNMFFIDLPQFESTIPFDSNIVNSTPLVVGDIYTESTWKNVKDKKLVKILKEMKKERGE